MKNIIYLGQKVCESCSGYCLDIIDIGFIICITFVLYKIGEAIFAK